jgi:hypothetical protein
MRGTQQTRLARQPQVDAAGSKALPASKTVGGNMGKSKVGQEW